MASVSLLSAKNRTLLLIVVLLLLSFAVYFNALWNDFVYDDDHQILENHWITDIRYIPDIFSNNAWGYRVKVSNYYRPIMHVIYMVTYYISGLRPWCFHLVNILFHAANSVMVFMITARLLKKTAHSPGSTEFHPAFIAALLFAAHPIHTEAVTWVAGLPDVSYAFFFLLALYMYMRFRDGVKKMYWLSVSSFAVATLCKEPALTLPFVLMAYDYCSPPAPRPLHPAPSSDQDRAEIEVKVNHFLRYLPFLAVGGLYVGIRLFILGGFSPVVQSLKLSAQGYIINTSFLFANYLYKLLLPLNLNAFHVFHPISLILEMPGLMAMILTSVFIVTVFIALRRRSKVSFGLLMITAPLLPALYIPAVGENVFAERYLYLPSFGFVILIGMFLDRAKMSKPKMFAFLSAIAIFLTALYSVATISRNIIWRDDYTLWTDTVQKSPDAAPVHYNLALACAKRNLIAQAIDQYLAALKLNPDHVWAHNNLGYLYDGQNRLTEAESEYLIAIKLEPDYPVAHYNLGNLYAEQNHIAEAIDEYLAALKFRPDYAGAHNNLGTLYKMQNRLSEAETEYIAALRSNPSSPEVHYNLGNLYMRQGRLIEAANEFSSALKIKPGFVEALKNLESCQRLLQSRKMKL